MLALEEFQWHIVLVAKEQAKGKYNILDIPHDFSSSRQGK
jgi:hypothetical protein